MQDFPHHYEINGSAHPAGDVVLDAPRLMELRSASPAEFGGPGDRWSPETLLVGAVADCFILTFRAIARASKLEWVGLRCDVAGTLDRVDRVVQFTRFDLHAHLQVAPGTNTELATRMLEKAEHNCLVSNSLKATVHLTTAVDVASVPASLTDEIALTH
jgi:peroxiredoxin-like protein